MEEKNERKEKKEEKKKIMMKKSIILVIDFCVPITSFSYIFNAIKVRFLIR